MSSVPGSSHARQLRKQEHEGLRPDFFGVLEARCVIIKVYDKDVIQDEGFPDDLSGYLARNPGYVYAKVKLTDMTYIYLPFMFSMDELSTLYGNSVQLEGRPAKILYRNLDLTDGKIVITGNPFSKLLRSDTVSEVHDISSILS